MPSYTNPTNRAVTFVSQSGKTYNVGPGQTVNYEIVGPGLGSLGQDIIGDTSVHSGLGAGYFQLIAGPSGCVISGVTLLSNSAGANYINGTTLSAFASFPLQVQTIQLTSGIVIAYRS